MYYLNGVQLPRDASQQALVGDPVDPGPTLDNLKVGDLLFFGSRASGEKRERVTHVAIYLGDTGFIHASGDVRINSFDPVPSGFQRIARNSFLRARRIIGAGEQTGVRKLSGCRTIVSANSDGTSRGTSEARRLPVPLLRSNPLLSRHVYHWWGDRHEIPILSLHA